MAALAAAVPDWRGGTRLGELLREFLNRWGQRGMARGAVVVLLSDGWERDDPELLGAQMRRLHGLAHRVIWANPRKARPGYAPSRPGWRRPCPAWTTSSRGTAWQRWSGSRRWCAGRRPRGLRGAGERAERA
ncbi:VWA domain-containing protein [Streptomyces diastatochromogenes]|nr:VWA domain-containing protein [Streptomyces diastatochromogenes]